MTACFELSEVDAYYGGAHILHRVSLAVQKGERIALIGRNGVGKTTVVNAMLGVAVVRRGSVSFSGTRVAHPRPFHAARSGIALVPQGRHIVSNLSVEENLILGTAAGRKGPWTLRRVFELFPILEERAKTSGFALSGGQQQMLAIGRALMANPDCLVLDEPSEGLAPVIIDGIADVARRIAGEGTAIFLIEQNLGLVHRVAESFCVMSKGVIVERGLIAGLNVEDMHHYIAV